MSLMNLSLSDLPPQPAPTSLSQAPGKWKDLSATLTGDNLHLFIPHHPATLTEQNLQPSVPRSWLVCSEAFVNTLFPFSLCYLFIIFCNQGLFSYVGTSSWYLNVLWDKHFKRYWLLKKIIGTIKVPPAVSQGAVSASDPLNIYFATSLAVQWLRLRGRLDFKGSPCFLEEDMCTTLGSHHP